MSSEGHEQIRDAYRRKPEAHAPQPWQRVLVHVGGVTAVGFGANAEWLLVLSHSGFGVIDPVTGAVVARERDHDLADDPYPLAATGIGPLAGERVPLAGLWGGGLRTTSRDGWAVHRASPNWPAECAVLCPPDSPELDAEAAGTMLLKDLDPPIRALGFSESGRTLVVANTHLFLWTRRVSE